MPVPIQLLSSLQVAVALSICENSGGFTRKFVVKEPKIEAKTSPKKKKTKPVKSSLVSRVSPAEEESPPSPPPPTARYQQSTCPLCAIVFPSFAALRRHTKREHRHKQADSNEETAVVTFCCDLCPKTFRDNVGYVKHMSLHEREQSESRCSICGKVFAYVANLAQHMKLHHHQESGPPPQSDGILMF